MGYDLPALNLRDLTGLRVDEVAHAKGTTT